MEISLDSWPMTGMVVICEILEDDASYSEHQGWSWLDCCANQDACSYYSGSSEEYEPKRPRLRRSASRNKATGGGLYRGGGILID